MKRSLILLLIGVFALGAAADPPSHEQRESETIRPWRENPWYWQYKGEPVMLLGGSDEDNLFNNPALLRDNFEKMKACGANYIRSTLSCRDEGDVWPFEKVDGKYDLDRPNPEFYGRLRESVDRAYQQGVIVQIELWATFDYYRDYWLVNPFNPVNNRNIDPAQTNMKPEWDHHPAQERNPFFLSIPEKNNETTLLKYQTGFVKRVLAETLPYPNVLYCIDNETKAPPEWSYYWAKVISDTAREMGVTAYTTEMTDAWDLRDDQHKRTWSHPDLFGFMEVSQNNWQVGQTHYDALMWMRDTLNSHGGPRPMSNVKVYHRLSGNKPNDPAVGIERWIQNVFAGCASTRFHRPDSGLGISEDAQRVIRGMRTFLNSFDLFHTAPAPDVMTDRDEDEAYCLAKAGKTYALYFPKAGAVTLNLPASVKTAGVNWFDPQQERFISPKSENIHDGKLSIVCPENGESWYALVECR
ncbi:MAG: hypothetical protein GC154_09420 [bacterium]|nr:hypothetical protein [bacterium]